jgi:hypothetical protein
MTEYPKWFLERIQSIKNKRPRIVAEHILKHGSITTDELKTIYGYNHAPRAARDLREMGIPLETTRGKNAEGRIVGTYRFGNLEAIRADRLAGRTVFSKQFKEQLVQHYGSKCAICHAAFEARYLQIDHRVPYEVAGDQPKKTDYLKTTCWCVESVIGRNHGHVSIAVMGLTRKTRIFAKPVTGRILKHTITSHCG